MKGRMKGRHWKKIACLTLFPVVLFAQDSDALTGADTSLPDYIPEYPDTFLEERMDELRTTIPMTKEKDVLSFIRYYTEKRRDYMREVQRLSTLYFPIYNDYLAKHQLPNELKHLSIVESGLRAHAISPSGAGGLWQFMPKTGVIFGLQYNRYVDDRRDFLAATEAACIYLKKLHARFDDWFLALAAFNAGEGRVAAAIRRSGHRSYWKLRRYLPKETRSYVPQFIALTYVMNYAHLHNIFPERHSYLPSYASVQTEHPVHLPTLARMIGGQAEEFLLLNPKYYRGIVPYANQSVRIPIHHLHAYEQSTDLVFAKAKEEAERHMRTMKSSASMYVNNTQSGRRKIIYRVRRGDVLGVVARRNGVRISDIKRWNHLRSVHRIRAGRKLVLWVPNRRGRSYVTDKKSSLKGYYIVQNGDSLWSISRKYDHLTTSKLKQINNLWSNLIKPGQRLRLYSD